MSYSYFICYAVRDKYSNGCNFRSEVINFDHKITSENDLEIIKMNFKKDIGSSVVEFTIVNIYLLDVKEEEKI